MSYRVGVIGCGRMAGTIDDEIDYPHPDFILPYGHAPGYAAVPETEIVAAADIDQTRLDTWCDRFGVTARYTDYRDMLASEDLDLVSTTTHAVARAPAVIAAAEAGVRGIYAEKALCASVAELDDILATCQRRNTHLVYGAMRRYWAGFETARKFLDSGALGSPLSVLIGCAGTPAFHGGSHFIDAALYLKMSEIVVEMMGKHSNLILVNADTGRIVDAAKHIDESRNRHRQILPGETYIAPPPDDRLDPFEGTRDDLHALLTVESDDTPWRRLMAGIGGFSPPFARALLDAT